MSKNWILWHGSDNKVSSRDVIETLCHHLVSPKKMKKGSEDEYLDGILRTSFFKHDCKIIDEETKEDVDVLDLPGLRWHKAVFELKHVYILGTKSFGFTKVLKYLSTTQVEQYEDEIVPLLYFLFSKFPNKYMWKFL